MIEKLIENLNRAQLSEILPAARKLATTKDERAIAPLVRSMGMLDTDDHKEVAALIVSFQRTALKPLLGLLRSNDLVQRINTVIVLGELGDRSAVPDLVDILSKLSREQIASENTPFGNFAQEVVIALGHLRDPRAVEILMGFLDRDHVLGYLAARSLGLIADARAVPHLAMAVKGMFAWSGREYEKCRRESVQSLLRILEVNQSEVSAISSALVAGLHDSEAESVIAATEGLRSILDRSADQFSAEDLRKITGLPDRRTFKYYRASDGTFYDSEIHVEWSDIKRLAQQEVRKRRPWWKLW